jgi:hypothetical protein
MCESNSRSAGLDSLRRPQSSCELDPSVGRSGPHAFAVRFGIIRLVMPLRPSRPVSRLATIGRNAPLAEAGRRELKPLICPTRQAREGATL